MKTWQSQVLANLNTAATYAGDIQDEISIVGGRVWTEGNSPDGASQGWVNIEIPDACEPTDFMGHLGSHLIFTEIA